MAIGAVAGTRLAETRSKTASTAGERFESCALRPTGSICLPRRQVCRATWYSGLPSCLSTTRLVSVELDRVDDRCGLGNERFEAVLGRDDSDGQGLNRHALREVDEVKA